MHAITERLTFDRQYDLSACREVGFEEKIDTLKGYELAFERMRIAKVIPGWVREALETARALQHKASYY